MHRCQSLKIGSKPHPIVAIDRCHFFVPVTLSLCPARCGAESEAHAKWQRCNRTLPFLCSRHSELVLGPVWGQERNTCQIVTLQSNTAIWPPFRARAWPFAGPRVSRASNGSAAIERCHFIVPAVSSSCSARCGAENEAPVKWQRCKSNAAIFSWPPFRARAQPVAGPRVECASNDSAVNRMLPFFHRCRSEFALGPLRGRE